jgi:hypothetical protein
MQKACGMARLLEVGLQVQGVRIQGVVFESVLVSQSRMLRVGEMTTHLQRFLERQGGACDVQDAWQTPWKTAEEAAAAGASPSETYPSNSTTSHPLNSAHASHQR